MAIAHHRSRLRTREATKTTETTAERNLALQLTIGFALGRGAQSTIAGSDDGAYSTDYRTPYVQYSPPSTFSSSC
ncbi:hypothetical protein ACJ73_01606 [Blastomyces percursus]|uniref:Uncharacterized protein n=1 Tax=Blastomyces percursus TaxID=1658174 RepID=A0A1J9QES2_9EURO|nr:hypothetical protein ACJ73_01606 [Blastomyces percursus]